MSLIYMFPSFIFYSDRNIDNKARFAFSPYNSHSHPNIMARYKMCDLHNNEVHSYIYSCSEITIHVKYSECVCRLRYLARNAHVPYCLLWPARPNNIFPHNLTNGKISPPKIFNIKCVYHLMFF